MAQSSLNRWKQAAGHFHTFGISWIGVLIAAVLAGAPQFAFALPIASIVPGSISLSTVSAPVSGDAIVGFDISPIGLPPGTDSTTSNQFGYLNVVSGNNWLVQNEPIPLSDYVSSERNNVWFTNFGGVIGSAPLGLDMIINDQPIVTPTTPIPDSTWTFQSTTPGTTPWAFADYTGQTGTPIPASPPTSPPPPPDTSTIVGYLRGGVADIKQYWNECGPTSTANSLIWLANKYGLGAKLPKKPDGTIDQQALVLALAKAMKTGWTPTAGLPDKNGYANRGYPGLNGNELKTGAEQYLKGVGLSLVVEGGNADPKASGANTFNFITKQLLKGQDVEFLIAWPNDGYHWVTVNGFIDAGKNNKTLIVHDPLLANGNNYWKINDAGKLSSPVGTAAWAVSESIPEPGTLALFVLGIVVMALRRSSPRHYDRHTSS